MNPRHPRDPRDRGSDAVSFEPSDRPSRPVPAGATRAGGAGGVARVFLRRVPWAATGAAFAQATATGVHVAEGNTLRIALIGCGGRGTGAAANALATAGPTKLWAMADVFPDRLEASLGALGARHAAQLAVPPERRFLGFDAFRGAIDALEPGDVVLLATPPAFRPAHLEYAVARGMHVFMEKSFAVDGPGIRRVLRAGEVARAKNLKIASGLMWRHDPPRVEVIRRLHDGAIGDLVLLRTYRMHAAVGLRPRQPGESELAHQLRNYSSFTWINGGFFVDWLIHNIDVCCWAKNAWPVSAQGMGGRQTRTEPDQMFDYYAVEYTFADGTRLSAQARHINHCHDVFSDFAHGSRGSAVIMESLAAPRPRIYRGHRQTREHESWRYDGPTPDPYQVEHDLFFDAIRQDRPYNEAERAAHGCLAAILGRMAAYSGQTVTWDQALGSTVELAPGLDTLTWDAAVPVVPDADGVYPVPRPGAGGAI